MPSRDGQRRVIIRKVTYIHKPPLEGARRWDGGPALPTSEPVVAKRRATPDEIHQLQAEFLRRLARLVREHADKAWFLGLPSGWFVRRDAGFLAEFKRLGRMAERAILGTETK